MYHTWILQVCTVAGSWSSFVVFPIASFRIFTGTTEFLLLREQLPRSEKHTDKAEKDKAPAVGGGWYLSFKLTWCKVVLASENNNSGKKSHQGIERILKIWKPTLTQTYSNNIIWDIRNKIQLIISKQTCPTAQHKHPTIFTVHLSCHFDWKFSCPGRIGPSTGDHQFRAFCAYGGQPSNGVVGNL